MHSWTKKSDWNTFLILIITEGEFLKFQNDIIFISPHPCEYAE